MQFRYDIKARRGEVHCKDILIRDPFGQAQQKSVHVLGSDRLILELKVWHNTLIYYV